MTTPGSGEGSYAGRVSPPGGLGVTSQGFGQEGYVLETEDSQPKPGPDQLDFAVGVPYFLPFATPYRDSWEIFRDDPVTVRQLVTMRRRDGQARALYRLLTKPILASLKHSDVIPFDGEEGGTEEAEYCKNLLFLPPKSGGMTHGFTRFVKQMLLALFTGFSAWEFVYHVPKTGPNKGKVCIRKLDWRPSETLTFLTDGQGEFNGFRQRCVTADTQIATLSGESVRIDEMVQRHAAGQEQWVYSCTKDGRVVPGKVKHAWKNRDSAPLVEVELDNGEKVRCTPDHPWMLRDGTYRWAEKLRPGDSLMPLYRKEAPVGASTQDYEYVQHPATGAWETTHRMVSDALGFGARGSEVIHHGFDGLKHRNNDPSNLHRMTRAAHCELHAKLGQLHRSDISLADIREAARELRETTGDRPTRADVAEVLGCSEHVIRDRVREAGAGTWTDVCRSIEGHELDFATVDTTARALHNSGVRPDREVVAKALSCSFRPLRSRLKAAGFDSWEEYLSVTFGIPRNHKVRSVRAVPNEAVYDLEVEEYHNFALAGGVFISNTFFQGRTIDVKIDREEALYYAHDEAERVFYGVSMFESAFYHYDKKEKLYYIAHLAAQRAAVGTRVGTMVPNANPNDKNNFIKALSQLGLAQYMVLPSADWTVQLLNETSSRFDFLGLINHHNSQMSKSVLAQWFDDDQGGSGGDSTLVDFGKQSDTTFMMMLEGILEEMAEVINNHIFPRFVDWNFGSDKYPQFKWGALTAEQKAAIQDTFDKLSVAGQQANVTPEFMLELEQRMSEDLGFDIDYDKIKKDREKQQKLMAQQQAMMGQPGAPGTGGGLPGQGAPPPGQPPVMAGNSVGGGPAAGGPPQPPPGPPQPPQQ